MQLTAKMKGAFAEHLKQRAAKWNALPKKVAARIVVPPELSWWYYHEFGVPHGYTIAANTAAKIAYPSEGGQVVADAVEHTGLKARHIVGTVEPEIIAQFRQAVAEFLRSGGADNPEGLRVIVANAAGEAKIKIADNMDVQLPGLPRPAPDPRYVATQSGKLQGAKAADVFRALAKVIEMG